MTDLLPIATSINPGNNPATRHYQANLARQSFQKFMDGPRHIHKEAYFKKRSYTHPEIIEATWLDNEEGSFNAKEPWKVYLKILQSKFEKTNLINLYT